VIDPPEPTRHRPRLSISPSQVDTSQIFL
jgi:hypothetical protein